MQDSPRTESYVPARPLRHVEVISIPYLSHGRNDRLTYWIRINPMTSRRIKLSTYFFEPSLREKEHCATLGIVLASECVVHTVDGMDDDATRSRFYMLRSMIYAVDCQ